ncbi:MAG: hypothetical protein V3U35_02105 [Candidatus Neomarinimicrobiota bacterium]
MGSFEPFIAAMMVGACLLPASAARAAQQDLTVEDFTSLARSVSMEATAANLPRGDFSLVSFTFQPVLYKPSGSGTRILPTVRLQWWVSPNLALLGGLGGALAGSEVVQLTHVGFRYLPEAAALGPFSPEFLFVQQRLDGLREYTLKWNHFQWGYGIRSGPWNGTASVALMYPRSFPDPIDSGSDVPGKVTVSATALILSAGYDVLWGVRLAGRLVWHPQVTSAGAQVSLAL